MRESETQYPGLGVCEPANNLDRVASVWMPKCYIRYPWIERETMNEGEYQRAWSDIESPSRGKGSEDRESNNPRQKG